MASSSPKHALDRVCIGKADDQPCNVTEDNLGPDCYESMHAFKKIRTSTSGLRKSPNKWTKEENQKLAALVASYGEKKWKRISAEMGGQKTGAQCAQHWKRVLSPEIRKGHWDEHEEDLLLRLVIQYGSCWKKIAKKIPQRTDIQCRYQYLKAKQSREVPWDAKEDESLTKKVMEMANCNFFQTFSDKGNAGNTDDVHSPHTPPTRGGVYMGSPYGSSPSTTIKDGADEEELDSSGSGSGSDSKDEDGSSMKSSGDFSKDAWNDDKHNVNMSDSASHEAGVSSWRSTGKDSYSLSDVCANCHGSLGSHVNKIVWLEISEHMARLKLTSTLRTALECKTRFMELLGNKISFSNFSPANNNAGLKNSGEMGGIGFGANSLRGSGGIDRTFHNGFTGDSTSRSNIGIQINNSNTRSTTAPPPSSSTPNNINLTNCNNNNITINITNSYTTTNTLQNGLHLQQIGHSTTPLHVPSSAKPEGSSLPHPLSKTPLPVPLTKTPLPIPILSPAPSFPSFPHLSFPHVQATTPLKPGLVAGPILGGTVVSRVNIASGLDSLAAVASILPREMLADYGQF